jgi:putative CocE/NonD family hydrolase
MFGDSYYGTTQWAAVSSRHPALLAIAPRVTGADGIRPDYWQRDGIIQLFGALYWSAYWTDNQVYFFEPDLSVRPLTDALDAIAEGVGARPAMWERYIPEAQPLEAYPHGHPFDGPPLPVLHQAGWFDNCLQPSINDWARLAADPAWAPTQYLNVDSIDHESYHLDDAPTPPEHDHAVVDAAIERMIPRYLDPLVAFFDVFVKGVGDAESLPRVRWNLGHVGDRVSESWPPPGARPRSLYLTDEGSLVSNTPAAADVSWVHDPADLVPSLLEDSFSAMHYYIDESPLHEREDVLTFTTEPFAEPLDLAGPVRAHLTVGTDGVAGAHVYLKLLDVSPDGSAHVLVRGQKLIPAGRSAQVTFDLTHAGYRVRPGHALRLHVASSDFPMYLPHPGTEENPWSAATGKTTIQSLTTGGPTPSHIVLTVLDAEAPQ